MGAADARREAGIEPISKLLRSIFDQRKSPRGPVLECSPRKLLLAHLLTCKL
jgi:hypothetical protein